MCLPVIQRVFKLSLEQLFKNKHKMFKVNNLCLIVESVMHHIIICRGKLDDFLIFRPGVDPKTSCIMCQCSNKRSHTNVFCSFRPKECLYIHLILEPQTSKRSCEIPKIQAYFTTQPFFDQLVKILKTANLNIVWLI